MFDAVVQKRSLSKLLTSDFLQDVKYPGQNLARIFFNKFLECVWAHLVNVSLTCCFSSIIVNLGSLLKESKN